MPSKKLSGVIRQMTIQGQLSFIDGNDYDIVKTGNGFVHVVGDFNIVETKEVISASLPLDEHELKKHVVR